MKFLVTAVAMLIAVSAQGRSMITSETFELSEAKLDTQHIPGIFSNGNLVIDYRKREVTLNVTHTVFKSCPEGMMCVLGAAPQTKSITLPIVHRQTDGSCGNLLIAKIDKTPVDGALSEIKIVDYRGMKCRMAAPAHLKVTYRQFSHFRGGEKFEAISTFLANKANNAKTKTFAFVEGRFVEGYSAMEIPVGGTVSFSEEKVVLNVRVGLNCKGMCPAYMPNSLQVELPVVKVEKSMCGDLYYAETTEYRVHGGYRHEKIVLKDMSTALCEIYVKNLISVEHTEEDYTGLVPNEAKYNTKAVLEFSR